MHPFHLCVLQSTFAAMNDHVRAMTEKHDWRDAVAGFRSQMDDLERAMQAIDAACGPGAQAELPFVEKPSGNGQPRRRSKRVPMTHDST